jgi:hypothetical protein
LKLMPPAERSLSSISPDGPQLIASEWSLAKGRRMKAQADRRC